MDYRFGRIALTLTLAFLASAADAQPATQQTQGKPSRQFAKGTWTVIRNIGLDDDMFDNPGPIAIDPVRAVVFDFGSSVVKSVGLDGKLEWTAGGKGRGPGEYVNPKSLQLDAEGRAIVYDPEAARITVLSREGKLLNVVRLDRRFGAALPGPTANQFLLLNSESDSLVGIVDTLGVYRPVTTLPTSFHVAGPITREMAGRVETPLGHLIAFRWTSRMLLLDRAGRLIRSCMGVDSLSLPPTRRTPLTMGRTKLLVSRVEAGAKESVQSVTALGPLTAILRPGVSADSQKVIDLYTTDCGRYVESRKLPVRASDLAGNHDRLVATVMDPVPHLVVLRWSPTTR